MKEKLTFVFAIVFLVSLTVVATLSNMSSVSAAPPAAPTPVANLVAGADNPVLVTFQNATALTADANSAQRDVSKYQFLDVQYVIDHGTVNTTTLTVQFSVDGSNWVNGPALVANSAADGSDITRIAPFGRYMRVNQNLETASAITITLVALAR